MANLYVNKIKYIDDFTQIKEEPDIKKSWIVLDTQSYDISNSAEILNNTYSVNIEQENTDSVSYEYPIEIDIGYGGGWEQGTLDGSGNPSYSTTRIRTAKFSVEGGATYTLNLQIKQNVPKVSLQCWNGNSWILDSTFNYDAMPQTYTMPSNATQALFIVARADFGNISPQDVNSYSIKKRSTESSTFSIDDKVYSVSKYTTKTYKKEKL